MRKKRKQTTTADPAVLVRQGEASVAAGRYHEAIEIYKQLLKGECRPPWLEGLANAYLGRAQQLADKGMYKEAAALWENRMGLCGVRDNLDRYLVWLLRSGRAGRAARLFVEADAPFQQSAEGQQLAALLAGLLVTGEAELAEALPADSPLRQQREPLAAALRAYCQGDDAEVREQLKLIPYRSPYRDLRLIVQALPLVAADPAAVNGLLARITTDSPFNRLAQLLRTAVLDGERFWEASAGLEPVARDFVLMLKGWHGQQIGFVNQLLSRPRGQVTSKVLFNAVISQPALLAAEQVQSFCLALLPDYPAGMAAYEQRFGVLPPLERQRLTALAAERRGDLHEATFHWRRCVEQLERAQADGEAALKAALMLRHRVNLMIRLHGPDSWDEQAQDDLARSLTLDPDDKKTYLTLMAMAQQRDDAKTHDQWLDQAVRRFPEDPDMLTAAAMAAYRRGAFKKAAGFALTLLERDPINSSARNTLLSAHLAHARKQSNGGKHTAAMKELETAEQYAQDDSQRGVLALNQGFLALLANAKEHGLTLLRQAYRQLGGGLVAQFRFLVDGQRLKVDQRTLNSSLNELRGEAKTPVTAPEMLLLAEYINRYLSDGVKGLPAILERLRGALKPAAALDYTEKEMQGICAALADAGHHSLLQDFAEAALKRWGQRPALVYYAVFGRTQGRDEKMTVSETQRLRTALNQALAEDDQQTAEQIEDFLDLPGFGFGPLPFPPPNLPRAFEDIVNELVDDLNLADPDDVLDALDELLRKGGPPLPRPPRRRR